jgi:hypothetical protein
MSKQPLVKTKGRGNAANFFAKVSGQTGLAKIFCSKAGVG